MIVEVLFTSSRDAVGFGIEIEIYRNGPCVESKVASLCWQLPDSFVCMCLLPPPVNVFIGLLVVANFYSDTERKAKSERQRRHRIEQNEKRKKKEIKVADVNCSKHLDVVSSATALWVWLPPPLTRPPTLPPPLLFLV